MMIQTNGGSKSPQRADEPVSRRPSRDLITGRNIVALMLREMSSRYGRNPGGYIWAFLEPLGAILVLSIGFSLLFRNPSLGNNFMVFYASGYIPFSLYQQVSLHVSRSIDFSRPLLRYPIVRWIDAVAARFILNAITAVFVGYSILWIIIIIQDVHVVVRIVPLVMSIALALFMGFGIGVLNCALIGLWPTWAIVWSIITRPLFILSGIIAIYDSVPRVAQEILIWNPLIHVVGLGHVAIFPTYNPNFISVLYVMIWGTVTSILGLILLTRYNRDIISQR